MKRISFYFSLALTLLLFSCAKETEKEVYMFSYFSGQDAGLRLAYSYDGLKWQDVADTNFLIPQVSHDKLMRDPSVTPGPDGLYHMVWTTSWHDKCIGYASTADFINWSEQKQIDVMTFLPETRNSWAPEITYNSDDSTYYIYWASTVPGRHSEVPTTKEETGLNHRLYYTTTKDFQSFTPTEYFYNKDFSVIDGALLRSKAKNDWILFFKNENSLPAEKNIRLTRTDDLKSGFMGEISDPISTPTVWSEGPSPLYIGDTIYVYYDKYCEGKYGASRSVDDANTWEDVSDLIEMPKGPRHGTMFKAPQHILDTLLAHYRK